MNVEEVILRQTMVKVRELIEPSPRLLSDIRAAIAVAERRRRWRAVIVCAVVLAASILALFVLVTIRSGH